MTDANSLLAVPLPARAAERYLAFDLGAESGRAIAAAFDGERLRLEEVHRFPNGPIAVPRTPLTSSLTSEPSRLSTSSRQANDPRSSIISLHWDVLALWREITSGLAACRAKIGAPAGTGIDAWGVDYALLGEDGALLGNPYHYRDSRTNGMLEEAFRRVPRDEIFARTGIQFMAINTLYQLLAATIEGNVALRHAKTLLMIPDLFGYWLTGRVACEFTDATTTQAYDPRSGGWAVGLLQSLGIRTEIFPEIVPPGTRLGTLRPEVAEDCGLPSSVPVTAVASHDTASAVAAVAVDAASLREGETYAYISSGTWSLVGTEAPAPVITPEALGFNFTNEGGIGRFRLLKNVMGLWLVQECRRTWSAQGRDLTYAAITGLAARARPFAALVDPDHDAFLPPGNMPQRMADFCRATSQPALDPSDVGAVARCAFESLALKYRWVIERLEHLIGKRIAVIHVIGGGSQNELLNQCTANACARPVIAGPAEATALGNALVQAMAAGRLRSLAQGRDLIRRSFPARTFEPRDTAAWDDAYGRFTALGAFAG